MNAHPQRFQLDRLVAGELAGRDAASLHDHLAVCPACRMYVEELQSLQRDLEQRLPPERFVATLQSQARTEPERPPERRSGFWGWPAWALGAAAASVLLLIGVLALRPGAPSGLRRMGQGTSFRIYLEHGGRTEPLEGQRPRPGDRLAYEVTLPDKDAAGYAAVIGLAGASAVALIPPDCRTGPVRVSGTSLLPGSVVLEAGGPPVRLWLIVRPEPFDLCALAASASTDASVRAPAGLLNELNLDLGAP
jgi:hypothetical protein